MQQVNGPAEIPFLGSILELRADPPAFFTRLARTYGPVSRFTVFGREAYLLADPELIREVLINHPKSFRKSRGLQLAKALLGDGLLTSEGEFHRQQRRMAAPAFAKARLAKYGEDMIQIAERHIANYPVGTTVDLNQLMMRLTLDIVNKTLFDADVSADAGKVSAALEVILNNMDRILNPLTEIMNMLPLPSTLRLREATKTLDDIVYRIIAERRASPGDRGDLLSIFLGAQADTESGHQMTDKQIRDECLTLFIAGHETTANALAWTLYLLAKNPQWAERARAEIFAVSGEAAIRAEQLSAFEILHRIFAESLRLYPPAWTISREAIEDVELPGLRVAKGATVVMSQWVMHRHEEYWENPEVFDPDRFLPEHEAARPKFAYFPFGGGPRQCIGDQFAWMEGVLILATLLRKFSPALTATNYVAEIHPMITLRPRGGMPLVLNSI